MDRNSPEQAALAQWGMAGPPRTTPDAGLINGTWLVGDPTRVVLQRLNPVFSPLINEDIAALTARLRRQGLTSPGVVPTTDGRLWHEDDSGCWRMLEFIPGRTLHAMDSPARAWQAGAMAGRFHAAVDGWDWARRAPRRDVHDTPARMADLRARLEAADGHPLAGPARDVGAQILGDWDAWEGTLDLPERVCHGDLKISNLRFADPGEHAICLIDLDTIEPMALACELGDAWRSWCNPAAEDAPARFDLPLFEASARGFLAHAPPLTAAERRSLVPGIERICLELASRFCADAVNQPTYFREDRARYPREGAHNLARARSQLALARSAQGQRSACERIVSR